MLINIHFRKIGIFIFSLLSAAWLGAQTGGASPAKATNLREVGGIKVTGAQFSDDNAIISISGIKVGDKIHIPGNELPHAIKSLWNLKLFTDVQILQEKAIGDVIFLEIVVQERPRFTRHSFKGVKKSYHDDLNAIVNKFLIKGGIVTENAKVSTCAGMGALLRDKGYLDATVSIEEIKDDQAANSVRLEYNITRGPRVKIQSITFSGNNNATAGKLRGKMENTKRKQKWFSTSKLVKSEYEDDKKSIIKYYNNLGFRDAAIEKDTIYREEDGDLVIHINIKEGNRYFFRHINWKGNSIYESKLLSNVLGIEKGNVYNRELLENRLRFSQDGRDISSLYLDEGYLFFQADPAEISIENDSIDLEIRLFEGPQATIDKVTIKGNDRTHEHVIRRELRTKPGDKFSRSDIIRSQREITNLGYFNPEKLGINTPTNLQRGTVDIEYTVEEKPSDQLELSAGWGGLQGLIGTLGVTFNNFSMRNIFNKSAWSPLPQGDGQRFSVRLQSNGRFYKSFNASFTEPWLGGKKPTRLDVGGSFTKIYAGGIEGTPSYQGLTIGGGTFGLGTRLKWPDDNFIFNGTLNLQNLALYNYPGFADSKGRSVTSGSFNNFNIELTLSRNSVNEPIFPRTGSRLTLSGKFTPPYSYFQPNRTPETESTQTKFKFMEYHKWKFNAEWYTPLVGSLVLKSYAKIGMLGYYNSRVGTIPFERFVLGGDGLSNRQIGFTGNEIISSRGYEVADLPASNLGGGSVYNKIGVELRVPFSLNPSATIFAILFAEGGNSWKSFRDFNPFDVRRAAGVGLRVFLPMFGTLGFDYGIGFDKPGVPRTNDLTKYGRFNIILGFEPD